MARKRKTDSTTTTTTTKRPKEKGNFLSDDALNALESGTYGEKYGRKATSFKSEDQTKIANPLPVLNGVLDSESYQTPEWQSRFSKAKQYQQNLQDEANKYTWNEEARANNTLDKKDQGYLQRLVDRFGDGDLVRSSLTESKKADWEKKYGKSIDQIYDDFIADQGNIKMERGKAHPILSELGTLAGNIPVSLSAIPAIVANLIAPDSKIAKQTEEARQKAEENSRYLRAGVKERTGDKGDKVIDTINSVGDRMLPTLLGNAVGGNVGGGILAGISEANKKMEDLRTRPMTDQERAKSALGYGAVEGLGTGLTVGALDWLPKAKGALGVGRNIIAGAGGGGIENYFQEGIEQGLDQVINGENSERELLKASYMLQGMDEMSATQKVDDDMSKRKGQAFLTGALFGGGMKTLGEIGNAYKNSKLKGLEETVDEAAPEKLQADVEKAPTKTSEKLQTEPGKVEDVIEDIAPETPGRAYTPDEVAEISDYAAKRDAIRAEMDKNVDMFNPDSMKKLNDLREQGKAMDAEIAEKYPELFNENGKFTGIPEQSAEIPDADVKTPIAEAPIDNVEKSATPANGEEKIRSFSKRGAADETLPDEIRETLSEDYYNVVRNKDVEARVDKLFDPENITQTRSNLDRAIQDHDPAAPLLGYRLAKSYIDNGDYDAATDVLQNVSSELTRMGQFTQAAKLAMLQNDPMAAMRSYMRDLEKLNEWGSSKYKNKWKKLELSEDDINAFNNIQKGDKEALNAFMDELNDKFGREIPASLWEKAVSATKTSMLLNLRTQGRNIFANMGMLPVRSASDRVAAVGQNIAHLINPDIKVTQSLTGGTKAQKEIAGQVFENLKDSILGDNKMKDSVKSDILANRRIWNDDFIGRFIDSKTNGGLERLNQKLGGNANKSMMETLQNFTYWLMGDFGDTPFVKKNFVNRLASYMKAQGIENIDDIPEEAINIAREEALKATFKDDNAFSKALTRVKRDTGKFGEVALPFVKTPANLAMRAVDYSPAGIINTIKKAKNGADASKVIDELSKNLTGTAMIYLGYKLREKGLLSGNYSDDPDEKAWQKQHGMLENALHIGDKYHSIDWMQPTVTPMILGSVMYDAFENSDKENADILSGINSTYKGGLAVANSWLSTSPLQSLTDILGGNSYSDGGIAENVVNEIIEFPQRFLPAQMGAAARTVDPVIRDTYSKDDSLTGIIGNQMRSAMSKVPGLSKSLPASYDTWGNERTRSDSTMDAFIAQNINPGQIGNNNPTPLDSEIQRIYDATGNNKVFPLNAARSLKLGEENVKLTNEQHSLYQKDMGQRSYAYAESIMSNPLFQSLSDDEKAEVLGKAYSLSNDLSKEKLFNHVTDNNKNLKEVARNGNANDVAQYLLDSVVASNIGMDIDKYRKLESENPGSAAQYAEDKQAAIDVGFVDKDGKANVEAYETAVNIFGNNVPAIQSYQEYKSQGFTKNSQKIPYLMDNNLFTDEQKGMILAGNKTYDDLGKTAKGAYDLEGYAGLYYFYLLKQLADQDGNGSIKKAERDSLLNSDNPYVTALSDDMYYYLAKQSW